MKNADKHRNLQDVFSNSVRKAKMPVTVFLVNGVKLQGIITWFDNFACFCVAIPILNWFINMLFRLLCHLNLSNYLKLTKTTKMKKSPAIRNQ